MLFDWARCCSTHFLTLIASAPMLDEVVSEIDTAPMPLDASSRDIKVPVVDALSGPFRPGETRTVISGAGTASMPPDAPAPDIKVQAADAIFGPVRLEETGSFIPGAGMPPNKAAPQIKLQPVDGILGHAPLRDHRPPRDSESAPARQAASTGLLRLTGRVAAAAVFCGLGWAAGAYYSHGHSSFDAVKASVAPDGPQSPQGGDIAGTMRQMAEDLRALKTRVDEKNAAPDAAPKKPLNSAQTPAGTTIADVMGRVDKLDAGLTAKLSQIDERLMSLEQQSPAPRATTVARAQPPQKRVKPHLHDAFDPSKDPNAPGVPRPFGSR
jgi:hypothetical protein